MSGIVFTQDSAEKKLIVALDFGTSFSGFAYSLRETDRIFTVERYPDSPISYCKTLSLFAYDGSEPHSFGYSAHKNSFEDDSLFLFKYFKMGIHEATNPSGIVTELSGRIEKTAMEVIVDFLKHFLRFMKETWSRDGVDFDEDEITWCLTIPAIWELEEKAAMKRAMKLAGYTKTENPSPATLRLILEPEAATIYCLKILEDRSEPVLPGETILILDAGGGTIDTTSHRFQKEGLEELIRGTGGDFGSMDLDLRFLEVIKEYFPDVDFDGLCKKKPGVYFDLLSKWEKAKVSVSKSHSRILVEIPPFLLNHAGENKSFRNGNLILSADDMDRIFSDNINKICDLIKEQITCLAQNGVILDYLFIVGGYGSSRLLQNEVKDRFKLEIRKKIVVPPSPGSAIVQGAILLGSGKGAISSRVMRYTWGVRCDRRFKDDDDVSKKILIKGRSGYFCEGAYDIFVRVGEEVPVGSVVSRTYQAHSPTTPGMILEFFQTPLTDCKYISSNACKKVGDFIVDMSSTIGNIDRGVEVEYKFGETIFEITARDLTTKVEYNADISYGERLFKYNGPQFQPQPVSTELYHIIFCNDVSGSMGSCDAQPDLNWIKSKHDNLVGALYQCCYGFLQIVENTPHLVSGVIYRSTAHTLFTLQPVHSNLIQYFMPHGATNGTSYIAPITQVETILAQTPSTHTPICFFMSDGQCAEGGSLLKIKEFRRNYQKFTLHTIGVGNSSFEVLKKMAAAGGGNFDQVSADLSKMMNVYESAAVGLLL